MWRHYVYVHRRASDGRVFYVGKGSRPDRMLDQESRNPRWHRVVAKHGLVAEVVAHFETDALSQQCERDLIAWFGRRSLVNMTDGGDGCAGIVMSTEARRKLSEHAKKPRGDAWIASIRKARKNGGNGGVVKPGDKLPEAWRRNLAAAKVGEKNPMHGKTGESHPRSRRVRDHATGIEYPSVTAAAKAAGLSMQGLHNMLTGHRVNTSTMELA
jgi:hypothetical protein